MLLCFASSYAAPQQGCAAWWRIVFLVYIRNRLLGNYPRFYFNLFGKNEIGNNWRLNLFHFPKIGNNWRLFPKFSSKSRKKGSCRGLNTIPISQLGFHTELLYLRHGRGRSPVHPLQCVRPQKNGNQNDARTMTDAWDLGECWASPGITVLSCFPTV